MAEPSICRRQICRCAPPRTPSGTVCSSVCQVQDERDLETYFRPLPGGSTWSEWFDGLTITNLENGQAVLSGSIADQAALHGVLAKIRGLGMALTEVHCDDLGRSHEVSAWRDS